MLTGDLNKQNKHSLLQSYKWAEQPHQTLRTAAGASGKRHQAADQSKRGLNRPCALTITF